MLVRETRNDGVRWLFPGWMGHTKGLLGTHGEGRQRAFVKRRNAMSIEDAQALRDRYFSEDIADVTTCAAAATRIDARHLDIDARPGPDAYRRRCRRQVTLQRWAPGARNDRTTCAAETGSRLHYWRDNPLTCTCLRTISIAVSSACS